MHRASMSRCCGDDRVPGLVVGGALLLFWGTHSATALRTGQDPLDRLLQLGGLDLAALFAQRQERSLVYDVGQVGAGETRCTSRDVTEVDCRPDRFAGSMQ